jgi:pimeloyl-ACP methyl ester carboxylesterase
VQTLVIRGEQDKYLLTSNLNGLEQYVLELTIKRIGDGPHLVLHEQPALVNASIQEFIY